MKKMIVGMIALVAVFAFCVHVLTTSIDKEKDKYKVKIGQKFILEKDTLTIIDYSSIMETFTLSNGQEVNASIVFNKDSVSVK
jgi:hypothetical protein